MNKSGNGEMVQEIKALASRPEDMSSNPKIHMVKTEN